MPKTNHNPNHFDGEVLELVKVFKYLGQQYLLGVIIICSAAPDITVD
jgi:hypothetical protein